MPEVTQNWIRSLGGQTQSHAHVSHALEHTATALPISGNTALERGLGSLGTCAVLSMSGKNVICP